MPWQKNVSTFVDKIRRNDIGALDEFGWMVEDLVQEEGLALVDAIASVAVVAAAGASGNEAKLREVTGCGPERWGARVRRMDAPPARSVSLMKKPGPSRTSPPVKGPRR